MLTEKQKMLAGMLYKTSDEELVKQRDIARNASTRYNHTTEEQKEERREILEGLLGSLGKDIELAPIVQFDYGCNTYIGDNCYINFNCTFLDCAEIRIGNNVFLGPNVSLLTPVHPLLASERNFRFDDQGERYLIESCKPITIGDNVWFGGNVTVTPGVTIGHDSVIGAGSVVTKDIPPGVVAAGVPCRVIREITEADSVFG
ncbi:sugar O-acetyltransferase [Paenibacillus senegalimassiliensis]|uniref:sugar O-acetyltransferase n=1 Tax=Paenibacillus senegalimassiliensis TaxID=1737426 RepID=UPI000AD7123B|nr:sugar O-acetyltransferase [Paenibacillus senegalimassiliensis]